MRIIIKKLLLLCLVYYNSYSQQLVQNIDDINKLKENETIFINNPLKDLLKEIKPEIKGVFAHSDPYFFNFKFITREQRIKKEGNKVSLFVYVQDMMIGGGKIDQKAQKQFGLKKMLKNTEV